MADSKHDASTSGATPPGGGRQDHDVMQAASQRRVSGGASTDALAAIGGLDVPGGEPHPEFGADTSHSAPEIIPGERDATTLTHREPGAIGGQFAGADIPAGAGSTLDERTAYEHAREGGDVARRRNR